MVLIFTLSVSVYIAPLHETIFGLKSTITHNFALTNFHKVLVMKLRPRDGRRHLLQHQPLRGRSQATMHGDVTYCVASARKKILPTTALIIRKITQIN